MVFGPDICCTTNGLERTVLIYIRNKNFHQDTIHGEKMRYKQSSIDIIGSLIESLTFPVDIKQVTNDGGGNHTVSVCDMYHAQPGFSVTIGGNQYTITDIIPAESLFCGPSTNDVLKIKGDPSNIVATTFNMYSPFFFYGTPIAEGIELQPINQSKNKTPMYWLRLDDVFEKFYEDDLEPKERDLKIRLYPLTQADHDKWTTADSKKQGIDPMHRLAEILVKKIKSMPYRFDVDGLTWDIPAVYPKFGVISINRGVEKSLWHDKLAGVELAINLTVYKNTDCETIKC